MGVGDLNSQRLKASNVAFPASDDGASSNLRVASGVGDLNSQRLKASNVAFPASDDGASSNLRVASTC
jgi:hypothetical protein